MPSISYEKIQSRFLMKIEDYNFLDKTVDELVSDFNEWLHSSTSKTDIRSLFSSYLLDDETQTLTYEMKHTSDEFSDEEFLIDILSSECVVAWVTPFVYTSKTLTQTYTSKEEKFYSESSHLTALNNLKKDTISEIKYEISNRSSMWNTYLES